MRHAIGLEPVDHVGVLDSAALPEGSWEPLIDSAATGAARGLGLSRAIAKRLSPVAGDKLSRIGIAVAEAILARPSDPVGATPTYEATSRRPSADVLLAAESVDADLAWATATMDQAMQPVALLVPPGVVQIGKAQAGEEHAATSAAEPTAGGAMRPLTDFGSRPVVIARRVAWAPDSKSIYAPLAETDADVVVLDRLLK